MTEEMFKMTRVQHMPAKRQPLIAESSEAGARGFAAVATMPVGESRNSGQKVRERGRTVACLVALVLVLLAVVTAAVKSSASVGGGVVVSFGPPPLPVYAQPPCPGPGYIWTPGYWAWDPVYGYYWVPGTWVPAPFVGALWTPGYWDYDDDGYRWHPGYWGLAVGFYGGIAYGFGYTGYGYYGGYWDHDRFFYNRAVNNIHNTYITNVYNEQVVVNNVTRVSYHGGRAESTSPPRVIRLRQKDFGGPARSINKSNRNGLHVPTLLSGHLLTTAVRRSLRPRGRGCSVATTSFAPRVPEVPTGRPLRVRAAMKLDVQRLSSTKATAEASSHSDRPATAGTTSGWNPALRVRPRMYRAGMTEGSDHLVRLAMLRPTGEWRPAGQRSKESSARRSITTHLALSSRPVSRRVRRKCEDLPGTPRQNAMGPRRTRKNTVAAMAMVTDGAEC